MLVLPIKKKWFDIILSGEKKRNIGKQHLIGCLGFQKCLENVHTELCIQNVLKLKVLLQA